MDKLGNTSSAVMNQRHEAHDSLDDFPTPPWATRALIEHVVSKPEWAPGMFKYQSAWDPACNRGYMVRPLREYFGSVRATDVHDYGWIWSDGVEDFLFGAPQVSVDWLITNPPFRLGAEFVHQARACARNGVAMLVRTNFLEGEERYRTLYTKAPPAIVAQFVERVPMVRGRHDPAASTATSYAWLVWLAGFNGEPAFRWIPPCRKRLQRHDDQFWEASMAAIEDIEAKIAAYTDALDEIVMGKATAEVSYGEFREKFHAADVAQLRRRIAELKDDLVRAKGGRAGGFTVRHGG